MRDLTSFASMKLKAALFVVIGVFSGILVVLGNDFAAWKKALLLAMCVWAFCRAYYFAFYVIEKYVDPSFKFSGLGSAVKYLMGRKASTPEEAVSTRQFEETSLPRPPTLPVSWWLLWLFMVTLASAIPTFHLRENVSELIEPLRYPWGLLPSVFLAFRWFGEISWYILAAYVVAGLIAWKKPAWGRLAILLVLVLHMVFATLHTVYSSKLVILAIKEEVLRRELNDKSDKTNRPTKK
ncbi:hypothetical protein DES53_11450 [Roseimicrobium gellanilyticum]|uniref:Uncharacterized protein n=1 Tax=Roseimicrobium gellanilyticum TaxID=748857 RepID=A0A366H5V7_9BACT|nr:hypothetical protein [Roseimicrobium gellanilyticum]RBP37312.1 hypothetical protein DES53_11450 [Roseimicrobium gellanilyticum]